jgi:hypothetical protein
MNVGAMWPPFLLDSEQKCADWVLNNRHNSRGSLCTRLVVSAITREVPDGSSTRGSCSKEFSEDAGEGFRVLRRSNRSSGLLFGYDTGVISGAILVITKQFSLSSTMEEIVVSAVLVGAVAGASLGGALTDRFGRRDLIIIAGVIFIASSLGTALSPSVPWLVAARVVSGIAIGLASIISPMYISELVPARVRGAILSR